MDHYITKYGNAVIYAIYFIMSWIITRSNMEVVIMQAKALVILRFSSIIFKPGARQPQAGARLVS